MSDYDATRHASPAVLLPLLKLIGRRPDQLPRVLDIGCGTGNYTAALAQRGLDIIGLDRSPAMLAQARAKHPKLTWLQGDATMLPFADLALDVTISTLSSHYWQPRLDAYRDIRRVTRGRFIEFTNCREYFAYYWLNAYFPTAIARSALKFPSRDQLRRDLIQAGFAEVHFHPWSVPHPGEEPVHTDGFLYSAKYTPARYLDQAFRSAIGTFCHDIEATELETGLSRLQADIASGHWQEIAGSYPLGEPDYLFVVAQ
ncbi:methyltransferase domain-containing protein [Chitinivorax sp. PXF-14]|uniref:class I SAM-dependent methyltransferase n=1 Tax=Chitinivorax sp. PXF-14 TaxID=3230488 RepID=UPI0034654442